MARGCEMGAYSQLISMSQIPAHPGDFQQIRRSPTSITGERSGAHFARVLNG